MGIFCDECKKNIATVFLTKISGEEVSKVQLCDACAKKMEETSEAFNFFAYCKKDRRLPNQIISAKGMQINLLVGQIKRTIIFGAVSQFSAPAL